MTMTPTLLISIFILHTSLLFFADSTATQGFTADLIRSDSTRTVRLGSRLLPDGSPFADIVDSFGTYLMKIQIGTPPFEIIGAADTGSNLIWAQCLPCIKCNAVSTVPIFNPIKSSTYKDVPCGSSQCQSVKSVQCSSYDLGCPYEAYYEDGTYSVGTVGTDTLTLNSASSVPFILPETIIGCGHNNTMWDYDESGIIGLGWGSSSLISQMDEAIEGLFSYCFGPKTSKINFGANAIVSGDGTVSTTIFRKNNGNHYYLNLEAVSVNGSRVETKGTSFHATDGNIVIDSGTTYTFLPTDYYSRVKEAVMKAVKGVELAPQGIGGELCYKSNNLEEFPVITMHFTGADVVLGRSNTFMDRGGIRICLSILPHDSITIFGALAQADLLIGYDTKSEIISFKATNCSAL